jgi:hypothetical protein
VKKKVVAEAYESEEFSFNFRLPLSLKLRMAYLVGSLSEAEKEKYSEFDLKHYLKTCLNSYFEKALGKSVGKGDLFTIILDFQNKADEAHFFEFFSDEVYLRSVSL